MPPKLKQYLNHTIMIAIPALFEDGKCRAYTLRAIDEDGLWLESSALLKRLLPEDRQTTAINPVIFVSAAQIAAVILAAPSAVVPPLAAAVAPAAGQEAHAAGASISQTRTAAKPKGKASA